MQDFFNTKILKNTKFYWLYISSLIITFIFWWVFAIRLPLTKLIPYWFWQVTIDTRPLWWLIIPVLIASIMIIFALRKIYSSKINLFILFIVGVLLQHTFGLMDGRGIDGIRDNTITTGHSAFAIEALTAPSFSLVASSYTNLIVNKIIPVYPNATKPPGQLLFYMLNERLSHLLMGDWDLPLQRLATFMSILWPLLACLPVMLMVSLTKQIYTAQDEEYYLIPSLFYIFIPSVILIPLHLDQSLYPFLFIFALTLFVIGFKRNNLAIVFISGFVTGLMLFVSFSLMALPFYILLILLIKLGIEVFSQKQSNHDFIKIVQIGFIYLLGFLCLEILLFFNYSYNIIENYQFAISNHFHSRIDVWTPKLTLYMSALNLLDYSLWAGVPLLILMLSNAMRSFKKILTGNSDIFLIMSLATPILFFVLAIFGKTVAETARLWIFLTPLMLMFAVKEITILFRERTWHTITFLLVLQILTTFSLKMWQDF